MTMIREANPSDASHVVRLVTALLSELGGALPIEKTAVKVAGDIIANPNSGFILLDESKTGPVAVCTVSHVVAIRSQGQYSIIQEMYVEPDHRCTNIGSSLLSRALQESVSRGSRFVELGTPIGGARQVNFYLRSGFISVGERLRWKPPRYGCRKYCQAFRIPKAL